MWELESRLGSALEREYIDKWCAGARHERERSTVRRDLLRRHGTELGSRGEAWANSSSAERDRGFGAYSQEIRLRMYLVVMYLYGVNNVDCVLTMARSQSELPETEAMPRHWDPYVAVAY